MWDAQRHAVTWCDFIKRTKSQNQKRETVTHELEIRKDRWCTRTEATVWNANHISLHFTLWLFVVSWNSNFGLRFTLDGLRSYISLCFCERKKMNPILTQSLRLSLTTLRRKAFSSLASPSGPSSLLTTTVHYDTCTTAVAAPVRLPTSRSALASFVNKTPGKYIKVTFSF